MNGFWDGGGTLKLQLIDWEKSFVGIPLGLYVGRGGGTFELKVTLGEIFWEMLNELEYGWGGGVFGLNPIPKGLLGSELWEEGCTGINGGGEKLGCTKFRGKLHLAVWLLVLGNGGFVCGVQIFVEKELFGTTWLWKEGGG